MGIKVYGFGSYFNSISLYRDIDILIVHDSNDYYSCTQAVALKKAIAKRVEKIDVSILSKSEESYLNMIKQSCAILLYEIEDNYNSLDIERIISKLLFFRKI